VSVHSCRVRTAGSIGAGCGMVEEGGGVCIEEYLESKFGE